MPAAAATATATATAFSTSAAASSIRRLLLGGGGGGGGGHNPGTLKLVHGRLLRLGLLASSPPLFSLLLRSFLAAGHPLAAARLHFTTTTSSSANHLAFPFALKACARLADFVAGSQIHAQTVKSGDAASCIFIQTSLVSLYAKCGFLDDAKKAFDEMPVRNAVSWTTIVSAYLEAGRPDIAVAMFRCAAMYERLRPDSFTMVRVLTACARLGDLDTGEWVRKMVEEEGMRSNMFVATALVDLYVKCGKMEQARSVFDRMVEKDIVAWGTMIGGYATNGHPREALELFFRMQDEGLKADCYTMVGVLSSCARLGALDLGQRVIGSVDIKEFLTNPVLGTALIDMYAKCGRPEQAWEVFQMMRVRDLVVWNAMILGLGMTGYGKIAFALFGQIEKLGIAPNDNTLIGLLCSCTHTGLVDDGRRYFRNMTRLYAISPRIEHYGCMVDLLSRAGLLEEARQLIEEMPMEANAVIWGALLGGCKIHRDTELAEHVLKKLIKLEPMNSGNYVMLSNIYSNSGRWDDAAELRSVMKEKRIEKVPAYSWVELKGVVHEFQVGDKSHPLSEQIYAKLDELGRKMKAMGYKPTTEVVLFDIEDEEKEHTLVHHSEKLAIAFSLITTGPLETIRVVKNLRVCSDCHEAVKLISRITNREIVVRDNNRFHCFKDGFVIDHCFVVPWITLLLTKSLAAK